MLRFFKGTGPGVIFLTALTLAVLWISAFIDPQLPSSSVYDNTPMPLFAVLKFLTGNSAAGGVVFSFAILILMLFLMVNFNAMVFFINERTFLPAVVYVLFSALFPRAQLLNPVLPAVVLLMLAFMRIMASYRKQGIAYNFFDAGILIGIGSLFYANLVWFGLLTILGIAIIRTGDIREIGFAVLGLIAPWIIGACIFYLMGKEPGLLFRDTVENLFGETAGYSFQGFILVTVIYSGLALILSIAFLIMGLNKKKIKARKTFSLLLWAFLISLIVFFALPSVSIEMIWVIAVPASYFLTHYFVFSRRKLISEIVFSGLFILILLIQVLNIFR